MKKPDIVFLDSLPLISDGLTLDAFSQIGHVTAYEYTLDKDIIPRARGAEIIIINKIKITASLLEELPSLKYIGETATGVDNIDIKAAHKHQITVTNVPDYSTDSVVQHIIALILTHTNSVDAHNKSIQQQEWRNQPYFSYWLNPLTELAGLTLGILGFGKVAKKLALVARTLGMNVIAHKPQPFSDDYVTSVTFDELLANSDILSLNCPLNADTRQIINRETLIRMKPDSILVNSSRGGLIDEQALACALREGSLSAAYLDVLTQEPPIIDNPLIGLPNCVITPHIAWASVAARKRLLNIVCENIIHFLNQQPVNVIHV